MHTITTLARRITQHPISRLIFTLGCLALILFIAWFDHQSTMAAAVIIHGPERGPALVWGSYEVAALVTAAVWVIGPVVAAVWPRWYRPTMRPCYPPLIARQPRVLRARPTRKDGA